MKRLELLLVVALLALAQSGAVFAESEMTDVVSENSEETETALDESGDAFATRDEMADLDEPASEQDGDEWADESTDAPVAGNEGDGADVVGAAVVETDAWDEMETAAETAPMETESLEADESASEDLASEITIEGGPVVVNGITLGPVGVDGEGRVGRVHTVVTGDTLWDVSHAYLGTSWVWPSVWGDNSEIANPHVIQPGNRLWISSTEIRAITEDEAIKYLASAEEETKVFEEVAAELPADFDAAFDAFEEEELGQLPVGMPDDSQASNETGRTVHVAMRENMGFVSDTQLEASTSILGAASRRLRWAMLDTIYLGLGEGEVEVGDEFTLYRSITEVRSPSNNDFLGYHVDVLGWAEVTRVEDESSVAVIRVSLDGAVKGDRAMPRYQPPTDVAVKYAEEGIDGEIAFMPSNRTLMGTTDYVFVDLGALHGVEIGTDLEVYDPGTYEMDNTRNSKRKTPDRVIADLVVITVQEETAVAFIAHTRRELAVGDSVRGATRDFPAAF